MNPSEIFPQPSNAADLGDLTIALLASTLAGMRDRLEEEAHPEAAAFVADLVDRCNAFTTERRESAEQDR